MGKRYIVTEIVFEATMMTTIMVVDMVKKTVVLIVMIDIGVIVMHQMDMEKIGVMSVIVQGQVIDMAVVGVVVQHVMREATERGIAIGILLLSLLR